MIRMKIVTISLVLHAFVPIEDEIRRNCHSFEDVLVRRHDEDGYKLSKFIVCITIFC